MPLRDCSAKGRVKAEKAILLMANVNLKSAYAALMEPHKRERSCMHERIRRSKPLPWNEHKGSLSPQWTLLFHRLEWWLGWVAWALGRWALLEVLEYLGTFSVLIAVVFYFADSANRVKQRHYQAWQVIDAAQGKGGSGGRIEALQQLNEDRVPLIGLDASGAFLQGIQLQEARLNRCNLQASDLRDSSFAGAHLENAKLDNANFRKASLENAYLEDASMMGVDLSEANLVRANLSGTDLDGADLRGADLNQVHWQGIRSVHMANVYGVRNAPTGFLDYAMSHGALSIASDEP